MKIEYASPNPERMDAGGAVESSLSDAEQAVSNPLFTNPREYMEFRHKGLFGYFKYRFEWHALDRCLAGLQDIQRVCDCPCGPGRLFPYWKRRFSTVVGLDMSDSMVEAAGKLHRELDLSGAVGKADAFELEQGVTESVDLVVSVRFFYYFERAQRIRLLRSLASLTEKHVLVMYKTYETARGRRNHRKSRTTDHALPKKFCSYREMIEEVEQAGLECVRIQPIAESSDRCYVLARRPSPAIGLRPQPVVDRRTPERKAGSILKIAAALLFACIVMQYFPVVLDRDENAVENAVQNYQDGNDRFYVSEARYLEDLDTGHDLTVLSNPDLVAGVIQRDRIESRDSFFILSPEHLSRIRRSAVWQDLRMQGTIGLKDGRFFVLSTETRQKPVRAVPTPRKGVHRIQYNSSAHIHMYSAMSRQMPEA